jgi:hypothetical protein
MQGRGDSLFHSFAVRLAQRLTQDGPNKESEYLHWVSIIYAVASDCFGGERIYGPRTNRVEMEQARARIACALDAGETPTEIARREGVSRELASKVRRQRGTIRSGS